MRLHVVKVEAACDTVQTRHVAPWTPAQLSSRNGTGVVLRIKPTNALYVLTCAHVVHGAQDGGLTLRRPNSQHRVPARLVCLMPDTDAALLQADGDMQGVKPIRIGDDLALTPKQTLYCGGYPLSYDDYQETKAEFTIRNRNRDGKLQISGNCNPGDSGGPCAVKVDGDYRLVGQIQSKATGSGVSGIVYATPISHILPLLRKALSGPPERVLRRPSLGFQVHDNSVSANRYRGLPEAGGVVVFSSRREDVPDGAVLLNVRDPSTQTLCPLHMDGKVVVPYCHNGISLLDVFNQTALDAPIEFEMVVRGQPQTVALDRLPPLANGNRALALPHEVAALPYETYGLTVTQLHAQHVRAFGIKHLTQAQRNEPVLVVTQVHPNSAFDHTAVEVGDIVRTANDTRVTTVDAYRAALEAPVTGGDGETYVKLLTSCGHDCDKVSIVSTADLDSERARMQALGVPASTVAAAAAVAPIAVEIAEEAEQAVELEPDDACPVPELTGSLPPALHALMH